MLSVSDTNMHNLNLKFILNQFSKPPPFLVFLQAVFMWLRYNIETFGVLTFIHVAYRDKFSALDQI